VPRTAVVIPCYNDGATLAEAVASLDDQEPCELVIVDDGSDDPKTLSVLAELKLEGRTVIHQDNRGLSAARMAGVEQTSAPYVLPLDADDLLVPGAVTALADLLDSHAEHAAAWGDVEIFGDVSRYVVHADRIDPWRLTYFNPLPYAALFRREALEAVGGWQLVGGYEDWDLWLALSEHGNTGIRLHAPALRYRVAGQRMWAEAVARHDQLYGELRRRHPTLFERRKENWLRSREPWRFKAMLPVIDRVRFLSFRSRRRLYELLRDPSFAASWLRARLRRAPVRADTAHVRPPRPRRRPTAGDRPSALVRRD
jgi:glycosyltransferase involved in cell wall biosynthesis